MGLDLAQTTDFLLKEIKKFLININKNLQFCRIEKFIFDGAEYTHICAKEMKEISEIFESFDLNEDDA